MTGVKERWRKAKSKPVMGWVLLPIRRSDIHPSLVLLAPIELKNQLGYRVVAGATG